MSAAFSADGSRIVTASRDGTARVWDAATSREIGALRGHDGHVVFSRFSSDGTRIVTASQDGTARVWDAAVLTMSPESLLSGTCGRLLGALTRLTRDEMRLAGYDDTIPDIDVCRD